MVVQILASLFLAWFAVVDAYCVVKTWYNDNCNGRMVAEYVTNNVLGEEWRWNGGSQENEPDSVSVEGLCEKVEIYDEDPGRPRRGYSDNIVKSGSTLKDTEHKPYCFNLPWDLQDDLGGLSIWARSPPKPDPAEVLYHEPMQKATCHQMWKQRFKPMSRGDCQRECDKRPEECYGYAHRSDTNQCNLCASTKPMQDNSFQVYFKQEFTCAVTIYNSHWGFGKWQSTYVGEEAVHNYYNSRTHSDYDFNHGFLAYGARNDQMSSLKVVGEDCVAAVFQHAHYDGWEGTYATNPGQMSKIWNVHQFQNGGAVNNHASSVKVRKLNCGKNGDGWVNGIKDGMRAGTEDIIDNCPSPGTSTAANLCKDQEYAFHKCPVSCEICTKKDKWTSTKTQTTVTGTTATVTTVTETTTKTVTSTTSTATTVSATTATATTATATTFTETTSTTATSTTETITTATVSTTTVTTATKTTQTDTTHTTTQTTMTFTDSMTTLTETTNTGTTNTGTTGTMTTKTETTKTGTTETGTTETDTTTTTLTKTTETGTTHTHTSTTTGTHTTTTKTGTTTSGTTTTSTTITATTGTTTQTTRTGTSVTATTITLTTTTIGPATFPIPVVSQVQARDLFGVIKRILDQNCFPDGVFEEAFNDDRIRLEEVKSGKRYIWDGGPAPDGVVYPMILNIWVNESQRNTKPNCTTPAEAILPVSIAYNVAPAAILLLLAMWIWISQLL
jgi:hypothetical protein